MTLKIRIVLYLTFNTKSNQVPRTFLWPFSQTFGLAYPPINSATLSSSSEVTLTLMCMDMKLPLRNMPASFPSLFSFHSFLRQTNLDKTGYRTNLSKYQPLCRLSLQKRTEKATVEGTVKAHRKADAILYERRTHHETENYDFVRLSYRPVSVPNVIFLQAPEFSGQ